MINLRPSNSRGYADHGWLQSFHSFSFASYQDSAHMGWGNLRVINEDRIAAGSGFGTHGHADMEIISYVLSGALAHQDSMGNTAAIVPGEVQRLSAGSGITHSEYNHAAHQSTHFLQIWLLPSQKGIAPTYAQALIPPKAKQGQLCVIAAPCASPHGVTVTADATLYAGQFEGNESAQLALAPSRKAYVHLIRGRLSLNGLVLNGGDGAYVAQEDELRFGDGDNAEVLVFDLAG